MKTTDSKMSDDTEITMVLQVDEECKLYHLTIGCQASMMPKEFLQTLQSLIEDYAESPERLFDGMEAMGCTVN